MTAENQKVHDEMMAMLLPLVDFLNDNGFGYWVSIGREGVGANYCGGSRKEVLGVTTNLLSRNEQIAALLQEALNRQLD